MPKTTSSQSSPSHTLFYWKPWKENVNLIESWINCLKDENKAEYSAALIGQYFNEISIEQIEAIGGLVEKLGISLEHSTDKIADFPSKINNTTQKGVDCILNGLGKIETDLSILNGNLELILEQQRITNLLIEVYSLPDREEEINQPIELGLKFFSKANKNPDLFEESLKEFLKAEKLTPQDYFVLHRIGMIYTYSNKHIDLLKALDYFTRAAKYASLERNPGAAILANILRKNSENEMEEIENEKEAIGSLASDSYEKAAFSSYIIGDFQSAVGLQKKSLNYQKEARKYFLLSKYQSRAKLLSECIISLESTLNMQPNLVLAVLKDFDLNSEKEVLQFIENKNKDNENKIDNILFQINEYPDNKYNIHKEKIATVKKGTYMEKAEFLFDYIGQTSSLMNKIDSLKNNLKNIDSVLNVKSEFDKVIFPHRFVLKNKIFEIKSTEFQDNFNQLEHIENKPLHILIELYNNSEKIFFEELEDFKKKLQIENLDTLFQDAARYVVSENNGSTSLIQSRMKLGYERAARLMAQLEATGIVGARQGIKERDVKVKTLEELDWLISKCFHYDTGCENIWTPTNQKYSNPKTVVINATKAIEKSINRHLDKTNSNKLEAKSIIDSKKAKEKSITRKQENKKSNNYSSKLEPKNFNKIKNDDINKLNTKGGLSKFWERCNKLQKVVIIIVIIYIIYLINE